MKSQKLQTKAKLVTLPPGGVIYRYKFELDGLLYTGSTGFEDFESAREFAANLRQEIICKNVMRKRHLLPGARRDIPLLEVVEQYWTLHGQYVVAAENEKPYLALITQIIGPKTLVSTIDRLAILEFVSEVRSIVSPITKKTPMPSSVNARLRLLRRVLIFARDTLQTDVCLIRWRDFWLEEDQRTRTLTIEEQNLMDDGSDYATLMRFFLLCGSRKSALLGLTWDRVHLDRREVELPRKRSGRKNGASKLKYYTIHMTGEMTEIIEKQLPHKEAGGGKVWTTAAYRTGYNNFENRSYVRGERKAMAMTAFEGWFVRRAKTLELDITIHDLRRTCGDEMMRATNGAVAYVQKMLDHHDPKVTMKAYAKVLGDDLRAACDQTAELRRQLRAKAQTSLVGTSDRRRVHAGAATSKRQCADHVVLAVDKSKKNRRTA